MGNRTILSPLKLTLERGAGLQATRHSVTDEAHFMKAAVVALTQVSALWERRMLRYK